jgi:hypothetical protein
VVFGGFQFEMGEQAQLGQRHLPVLSPEMNGRGKPVRLADLVSEKEYSWTERMGHELKKGGESEGRPESVHHARASKGRNALRPG